MSEFPNTPGWFVGCGSCRGSAWVKNAAIVRDRTCDQCRDYGTDPNGPAYVLESLVNTEVGWCGCGDPSEVDAMMLAYLRARSHPEFPKPPTRFVGKQAEMLLAYVADRLGWTEHGTSIGGAWLSDDGIEALKNLEARYGDQWP